MGDLRNLIVGIPVIFIMVTIYYIGYLILGPNTDLYNASTTAGGLATTRAAALHTKVMFSWKWGFRMGVAGVILWMIISAFKEEQYEAGYGY